MHLYLSLDQNYATTLQSNKQLRITTNLSSATVLTTWIRFQWLQDSNRTVEDLHISILIATVWYKYTSFSKEKRGRFSNPQSTYHISSSFSLLVHYNTLVVFLCRSSLTNYWFSHTWILGRHRTGAPNSKDVFFLCVLWQARSGVVQSLVAKFYQSQTGAFIESLSLHLRSSFYPTWTPIFRKSLFSNIKGLEETNDCP